MSSARKILEKERINREEEMLSSLLAQCTEGQRKKFKRVFPGPVPEDEVMRAIDLVSRTVEKNKEAIL